MTDAQTDAAPIVGPRAAYRGPSWGEMQWGDGGWRPWHL